MHACMHDAYGSAPTVAQLNVLMAFGVLCVRNVALCECACVHGASMWDMCEPIYNRQNIAVLTVHHTNGLTKSDCAAGTVECRAVSAAAKCD